MSRREREEMVVGMIVVALAPLLGMLLLVPRINNPVTYSVGFRKEESRKGKAAQSKSRGAEGPQSYSKAEVSLHNKRDDCWIIIKDKFFDVSPYVEEHPGGNATLNHAGDDSTEGFYGVFQLVNDFCIGYLKQ